jgi:FkbM family methyltransferase
MSTPRLNTIIEHLDMTFDLGMFFENKNLRALLKNGQYENKEIWMVEEYLDPELPVVELGGGLGVVSCVINRLLARPEHHIVVEANPYLIELLEENKKRNGSQFEIVPRAIGYSAQMIIHCSNRNPCLGNSFQQHDKQVNVKTTALRNLITKYDFRELSLVSDIEGAEAALFTNEIELLAERVKLLIFEAHPEYVGFERVRHQLGSLVEWGFEQLFSEDSFHVFRNTHIV